MKIALTIAALVSLTTSPSPATAQRKLSAPALKSGETSFYRVHVKIDRDIKARSALSFPQSPTQVDIDVQGILQVEVLPADANTPKNAVRFRTWFLTLVSDFKALPRGAKSGDADAHGAAPENKSIDCTLEPTGEIDQITGLDALAPEQQQAWREWAERFAAAFLTASQHRVRGERWSSEEPETAPAPLAALRWQIKSHYVRDEPCNPLKFTRNAEFQRASSSETCAAIISTATLVQKSSPRESTPTDYKQRNLRTSGTATGNNDVTLSISRKTGQLIRAAQNAKQSMDVFIALADGSTQVHYEVSATATTSVELVMDPPLILQPKASK